jgi:hypothetical protein
MNNYLIAVVAFLVLLVATKRVESMKMEEKQKKMSALKKFML